MAHLIGPQLTEREVIYAYTGTNGTDDEPPPIVIKAIRAFPVPALEGVTFTCAPEDFHAHLDQAVASALPSVTLPGGWRTGGRWNSVRLVEKYHILDGSFTAPPDTATGQAMVIELAGLAHPPDRKPVPLQPFGPAVKVTITKATWTNVGGIFGPGFYM